MTGYSGTFTARISGIRWTQGPFERFEQVRSGSLVVTMSLGPGGILSGTLSGTGIANDVAIQADGSQSVHSFPLTIGETRFATTLEAFDFPLERVVHNLLNRWTETNDFGPLRAGIGSAGSGDFGVVTKGTGTGGQNSAQAQLTATTSAYSIAALGLVSQREGDTGPTVFRYEVTRVGNVSGPGSVAWSVMGGANGGPSAPGGVKPAAGGEDFVGGVLPQGVLDFLPGETVKTLTLAVRGDAAIEPDEWFTVRLANAPDEVMAVVSDATGVIVDDDTVRYGIYAVDADLPEGTPDGGADATAFTFALRRDGRVDAAGSVSWKVEGADVDDFKAAPAGERPSGTVAFLPGETEKQVTVFVAKDAVPEGHDAFRVRITNPSLGVVAQPVATGLIINDDGGPSQVAVSTPADETFDMGDGDDLVRFSGPQSAYRIGVQKNHVVVQGPDGTDDLVDVEYLKFASDPAVPVPLLLPGGADELIRRLIPGSGGMAERYALPQKYAGPLDLAYVFGGTDGSDVVAGTSRNDFMNLGGGNDAADMGAGDDIVDGGGGNNFLTGGAGRDSFFLDGRFAVPVWSCITDWEPGEVLALWGWRPGVSVGIWGENAGLPGYLGATYYADIDGNGLVETALTITGRMSAEIPAPAALEVSGIGLLKFG